MELFSQLSSQLESLQINLESNGPSEGPGNNEVVSRIEVLGQQVLSIQESLNSNQSENGGSANPELVDQIVQKLEAMEGHLGGGGETSEHLQQFLPKLDSLMEQMEFVQASVEQSGGGGGESNVGPQLEILTARIDAFQEFLGSYSGGGTDGEGNTELLNRVDQVGERLSAIESTMMSFQLGEGDGGTASFDLFAPSFEALTGKLETLQAYVENQPQTSADYDSASVEQLSQRVEQIAEHLAQQPVSDGEGSNHEALEALSSRLAQTESAISCLVNALQPIIERLDSQPLPAANPGEGGEASADDSGESSWESQKRAMLQGYGVEYEEEASDSTGDAPIDHDSADGEHVATSSVGEDGDVDSPEVDNLRAELEEKLRRAEVEISIERAKLLRERHELEQKETDMQREIAKLAEEEETNENGESPGRWSRFLGN